MEDEQKNEKKDLNIADILSSKVADAGMEVDLLYAGPGLKPAPASEPIPLLFNVDREILPAKRRAIAVDGLRLANGQYEHVAHMHEDVFEIWEIPAGENGAYDLREATLYGRFRHVEIHGTSWLHHNPETPLGRRPKRVAVMVTDAPLTVCSDTAKAQEERRTEIKRRTESENAARAARARTWGC